MHCMLLSLRLISRLPGSPAWSGTVTPLAHTRGYNGDGPRSSQP